MIAPDLTATPSPGTASATATYSSPAPSVPAFVAACMRVRRSGSRMMPMAATNTKAAPIARLALTRKSSTVVDDVTQ